MMMPLDTNMPGLSLDSCVADVLERWPALVPIFNGRRMACPGCAMAPFMTLREAADSYGQDPADLLAELSAAIPGD